MKANRFRSLWLAACAAAVALAPARVLAQDTAVVNPHSVRVVLDNPKVRVLDVNIAPGAKEEMHSHPAYLIYVLSGGKVRGTTKEGKVSETVFEDGKALYREPLTHSVENIGGTNIHLLVVELKPAP